MAEAKGVKAGDDLGGVATSANTDVIVGQADATAGGKGDEGKLLTQSQVNEIVSKRVNETKEKFSGDTRKAAVLDNMLKDPAVTEFLEKLGQGLTPTYAEVKKAEGKLEDVYSRLNKLDPQIAPVVKELIETAIGSRVEGVQKDVTKLRGETQEEAAKREFRDMTQATDEKGEPKFPWLEDPTFKGDMASLLEGGRAFLLEDAYDLAAIGKQRDGKEPPKAQRVKEKENATLLESHEGGAGGGSGDKGKGEAPIFKSFEECFEKVCDTRGWYK